MKRLDAQIDDWWRQQLHVCKLDERELSRWIAHHQPQPELAADRRVSE